MHLWPRLYCSLCSSLRSSCWHVRAARAGNRAAAIAVVAKPDWIAHVSIADDGVAAPLVLRRRRRRLFPWSPALTPPCQYV